MFLTLASISITIKRPYFFLNVNLRFFYDYAQSLFCKFLVEGGEAKGFLVRIASHSMGPFYGIFQFLCIASGRCFFAFLVLRKTYNGNKTDKNQAQIFFI